MLVIRQHDTLSSPQRRAAPPPWGPLLGPTPRGTLLAGAKNKYIYIYIYVYVYTYIHTYIHTYIYRERYIKRDIHVCIYIYIYTHVYVYIYTHICIYIYIYIEREIYTYVYIYIYIYIMHTGNRHLGNHRGFSVALSNRCLVACSNGISLVSGISQRIVTFPVDVHWKCPMDVQWHRPIQFHFCEF